MSVVNAGLMLSAPSGYTIDRSLRLRSSASAYLSRTPASAGNRKTWTWSGWVKRGTLGSSFSAIQSGAITTGSTEEAIAVWNDFLYYRDGVSGNYVKTSAVFRDPSAWYHVVFVYDSANATQANRGIFYVNGVRQSTTINAIPLNRSSYINYTTAQGIGRFAAVNSAYFDGYLTEVNFIDGQALDPSSFGEYNEDTGVWQPIKYVGTYGTNGFYLNFSDNSTTTTLGYDTSGNGNNWTANNISVTSGVTYDSMTDVPTLTSETSANYCVINPLNKGSGTVSDGNLLEVIPAASGTAGKGAGGTIAASSGKWYAEFVGTVNSNFAVGVMGADNTTQDIFTTGVGYYSNGNKYVSGTATAYGAAYTTNDVIGVALDIDSGTVTFYKNNVSQGAITLPSLPSGGWRFHVSNGTSLNTQTYVANFGQRPFAYTPPTGFKALNTYNLPDSTIEDGSDYFNTVLYTGTGTTNNIVTGVGFQSDFTWIKDRTGANYHSLHDAVRGVGQALQTNNTGAELSYSNYFGPFSSDGFTVAPVVSGSNYNNSGNSYVAWNWKANGSGVSNTDGSITSTVSANTTAGFSIVSYTGDGSTGASVGHGLGAAPQFIIVKNRDSGTSNWNCYVEYLTEDKYIALNQTAAATTSANYWADGSGNPPNSSTFFVRAGSNTNTNQYIAYCFAEVEGFSKMGSYTGNGSTDGPFVFTGFRPAFVLIKRTDNTNSWVIWDTRRSTYNPSDPVLLAESSGAEFSYPYIDVVSNGFKVRGSSGNTAVNASGGTFIYMAFAEVPQKFSLAR